MKNRIEKISNRNKENREKRQETKKITELWDLYNFPGRPPKEGGDAEAKLIEACREHVKSVLNREAGVYESKRRESHNKIAKMIYGKDRNELDNQTSELLSDFAAKVILGKSIREAFMELESRRDKAA